LIAGGEDAFRARPFLTFGFCSVVSPLAMDFDATEMLMHYAENGIPSHSITVPHGGLSAPFTLAAPAAQGNAEFLAATVLGQMSNPGTPVLYSVLPTMTDLRSGAYAAGAVETGMLDMVVAQLAQCYRVPSGGYIGQTNAKIGDAQAGYEKALSPALALLAGFDFFQLGGLVDALLAFDYGQAVIDNEIAMMLKRVARGVEFSEANLALDVIKAVGPAGMFVDHPHTFERMLSAAYLPDVADRAPRETWIEQGATDMHARALVRVREILTAPNAGAFSADVDARVRAAFGGLVAGDSVPPAGWEPPPPPRQRRRGGRRHAEQRRAD
jgi:trimethylamine--corrinoid protein Co-methyltransferase